MQTLHHFARLLGRAAPRAARSAALLAVASLTAFGCSVQTFEEIHSTAQRLNPPKKACDADTCIRDANYQAADTLVSNLKAQEVGKDELIVLTTFADVDDLGRSTTLGRLIPQQISSRLAQKGWRTVEIKDMPPQIEVREGVGEFALSRRVEPVNKRDTGYAVLSGTYAVGANSVMVNARIIRSKDHVVLAGADYDLPATLNVQKLAEVDLGGAFGGGMGGGTGIAPSVSTVLPAARENGQGAPLPANSTAIRRMR